MATNLKASFPWPRKSGTRAREHDNTTFRRGVRGFRALRYTLTIALIGYLCGFGYFLGSVRSPPVDISQHTDAAIVLTGGSGRVAAGLSLLEAKLTDHLFISGVNPGTEITELARLNTRASPLFSCCVEIGHKAADTIGNAAESAAWMHEKDYHSLRLVTSDYHMPRALLEFHMALPETTIVADAVRSRRRVRLLPLLLAEYSKFLVALARSKLGHPA